MNYFRQIAETPDLLLLEKLANDPEGAVKELYKLYFPVAAGLVMSNSGSEEDARDIFQEAVIVLYEKAKDDSFELHCRIKTYLYSVCRRLWLKTLHQRKAQITLSPDMEEVIPVEEDLQIQERKDEEFKMMETAMSNLGEPCKTLLEDYYLRKKSMHEIAERFGYTNADNAKNQKYKCLMRLRKLFFIQYKKG